MNARILLLAATLLGALSVNASDAIDDMLALWNYQDPAATEGKLTELLAQSDANNELSAATLSQIARTHSLRRNFDTAHAYLDLADQKLNDTMKRAQILIALERGRAFNSNNQLAEALPHFRLAFTEADAAGMDGLCVDAAHMIAIAEEGQRAERWNLIAMQIAETSEDPDAKRWLGPLYNNLGWTYFDAGQLDKALNLFEKSVAYRKANDQTREWQIARWTVARTWREQGRLEDALAEQLNLIGEVSTDGFQLGYINEEIGEIYLIQDNPDYSKHFAVAHDVLSQDGWLVANEADRLARLAQLGGNND